VSELHYHPAGVSGATEFVELLNITGTTLDLGGCHFAQELGEGIAYTFPAGVQLPPGGRILIVRDRTAFAAEYPAAGPLAPGEFAGALDNGGESLVLYAASGLEIFRFTFTDSIASTDGLGRSLVRVLSSTNPNPNTYVWRASIADGGNPGASDALAFIGSPLADADDDGVRALIEYACGTSDADANSLPTAPQLAFVNGLVTAVYPLAQNADDIVATVETSTDLANWAPVAAPVTASPQRCFRLRVTMR
jgi:hypothetical protein